MHVLRRGEQRREREHQDQDRGGEEAEHGRAGHDAVARQQHDPDDRRERAGAACNMRPCFPFQPSGDREQQKRGRDCRR